MCASMLSNRILRMPASETLAMSRRSSELQSQGIDVINLSIGEPDFDTPELIKKAGVEGIEKNFTHYPPVPGYLDLREAIAKKLIRDNNLEYKPSQIVVSNGAKHSLTNVFLATLNEGDEVIIPTPYWVSYPALVQLCDGISVYIKAGIEQNFKVTAAQIQSAITSKTKLLILNSPSNPTGMVYTHSELRAIANVLLANPQVYVVADEIYEYINFSGKHESLAQFPEIKDRVIVVNGVSKGYAMTGWRIGYIAACDEIAGACSKIQGQMTSAASSIAQRAAIAAMTEDPKKSESIQSMVKTFKERRDVVMSELSAIPGLSVNMPEGAFYVFLNIKEFINKSYKNYTIHTGADLANYLLDEAHVALVGGDAFGDPQCVRISYATKMERLVEAIARIKTALTKLA
ncbi:MAG: pyridoxal phosphate-dependent aminotransferase [Bacteroidales bacterium]